MLELIDHEKLHFSFPEVHKCASMDITFMRTLRVPDDGRENCLPPGLGIFEIEHVADHANRLSPEWVEHGGVLLPMYQAEAMWLNFDSEFDYPFAVKIGTGKRCAITGKAWREGFNKSLRHQNYVVVPDQPWLDGFNVGNGMVRQFVAMPLGQGYTAEEQLSGKAKFGGIQIEVIPLKEEHFLETIDNIDPGVCYSRCYSCDGMGIAPGGAIAQEIEKDTYGYDKWDIEHSSRVFVHLMNSTLWQAVTGREMPRPPISANDYNEYNLPWFTYYSDNPAETKGIKGLKSIGKMKAVDTKNDKKTPSPKNIVHLGNQTVKDGNW